MVSLTKAGIQTQGAPVKIGIFDPDRRLLLQLRGCETPLNAKVAPCDPNHGSMASLRAMIVAAPASDPASAIAVVRASRSRYAALPVVFATNRSSEELVLDAFHAGVADYLREPLQSDELLETLRPFTRPVVRLLTGSWRDQTDARIRRLAQSDTNVLITGESGTGKDIAARMLHAYSPRRNRALLCVNCAAIPESLLESELFGYEKGAFTGADRTVEGKFQAADGGTMFFDEIGDLTLHAQAKLLRTIENKEVQQLGAKRGSVVDVRIVAATHRDLESMAARNEFRQDLFYRLDVARIHLSPLRERTEDIPVLLEQFITEFNQRFGCTVECISADLERALLAYHWPGNVRELRNMLEATFVDLPPRSICFDHLPEQFRRRLDSPLTAPSGERERLVAALTETHWNRSKTAEKMSWSRMTLYRKMMKYQLHHPRSATD